MSRRKAKKQNSERWMISYADLLTLMLAFFIVLYSQSALNISRLKEIARGMIVAFHGTPHVIKQETPGASGILKHHHSPVPPPMPTPKPAPPTPQLQRSLKLRVQALRQARAALQKVLAPLISTHQVQLSQQPLSLRIRLNSKILYPSGQATLTPKANVLLGKISAVLVRLPHNFPVVVQGYTNKKPIHNAQFPSNWELSTLRAVNVVHLFRRNGMPGEQLSAQGYSKFHPLRDDDSPEALRVNRRVAILIQAPDANTVHADVSLNQLKASPVANPVSKTTPSADHRRPAGNTGQPQAGGRAVASRPTWPALAPAVENGTKWISLSAPTGGATAYSAHDRRLPAGSAESPYLALKAVTKASLATALSSNP